MLKTHFLNWLLGAALISSSGALALAQDAAANASGKASAESEATAKAKGASVTAQEAAATSSKASATAKKAGQGAAAATSAEARAGAEGYAEIERGLAALKSGTSISTELDQAIDASKAKLGDTVSAKVTKDVKHEGRTIIRKGDRLVGSIAFTEAGAKGQAGSDLRVTFDRLARGNAEYRLNTVLSSVISTSGDMNASMQHSSLDDPMMTTHPSTIAGGGGGRPGGGSLLGGATSTAGSAAGGLAGNVGGTASSAIDSAGAAVSASEHGSARSGSSLGISTPMRDIRVTSHSAASQSGETTSVLAARRGNLRLDSGTRLKFKVMNQSQIETSKK